MAQNLAPQLDGFLFDICLPMLAANQKDEENWQHEPSAFLYSQDARVDAHNIVKNASKDLIDQILRLDDQAGIPMTKKLLDYMNALFET